jgi:hypothetical protein
MPITTPQGTYTGLLGYDREYEYLGDSNLPFRIVENYTYEVFDTQLDRTEDLAPYFKTQFAAQLQYFSGDVNITSLEYPQSEAFNEDGMRFQKFNITIQSRTLGTFFEEDEDGYQNTKNAGLGDVVAGWSDMLKDFSEKFSFSFSEEGNKNYSHSLNFSLITGTSGTPPTLITEASDVRNTAGQIAAAVFAKDFEAELSLTGFTGYVNYVGSDSKQYASETFDELTHTYSFQKNREILPYSSGEFTHSMDHAINYGADGYFRITESLSVFGKKHFNQALTGFDSLTGGSSGRCAEKIAQYAPIVSQQTRITPTVVSSGIKQVSASKVFKIPELTVDGSVVFTNDPSYHDYITRSDELSVERDSNGTLKMNHSFNYSLLGFVDGVTDTKIASGSIDGPINILQFIATDRVKSISKCQSIYSELTGVTGRQHPDALTLVESNITAPVRGKAYSASFSFSDDPMYDLSKIVNPFTQTQITGFKTMDVSLDQTEPKDIIEEYKIINRESKQSVLSYGYQQEPGSVSINCKGQLVRPAQNLFEQFKLPTGEAVDLLKYSKGLFLNHVMYDEKLYNYFLRGSSYTFGSENTFDLNLDFVYTRKR